MSREVFEYLNDLNQQMNTREQNQYNDILKIISHLECRMIEQEFIHIQDMYKYINTNPYLKTQAEKDATFHRYVDIFRKHHAEDLNYKIYCHHDDNNSTTLLQALDIYLVHP
jgi:hypothetical protein